MRSTRSVLVRSLALTAALGLSLATASPAMAGGGDDILRDGFKGSFPLDHPRATPIIAGVSPGGAPWELDDDSEVRVRENGRIKVEIDDLVIPDVPPVPRLVAASLVCKDMVVASTPAFALDNEGDGEFEGKIWVPKKCNNPVVLIRNANAGAPGAYFAFTDDHKKNHHHD